MEAWRGWYPGAPPLAHLLREAHPERWLRIHSLPESRRYPETDADWAELLRRHDAVATDVLGDGARCALVPVVDVVPAERMRDPVIEAWEPEPAFLHGAEVVWRAGAWDEALRAAAMDEARFLMVELEHGRVYAPYDGGADLFLPTSRERDEHRARHAGWLSRLPSGL
jgi:hypothetical protein